MYKNVLFSLLSYYIRNIKFNVRIYTTDERICCNEATFNFLQYIREVYCCDKILKQVNESRLG